MQARRGFESRPVHHKDFNVKTETEQIEFSTKLQELTDRYGQLIEELQSASDKFLVLEQMQSTLHQMNVLCDSYMPESL